MPLSLLIATIGLVPCCFQNSDKQSDLKSRLLEEGPAAWRALDERIKQVEGSYQYKYAYSDPTAKDATKKNEVHSKEDSFKINQSKAAWTSKLTEGILVILANEDYLAVLESSDTTQPSSFSIRSLSEQTAPDKSIYEADVDHPTGKLVDIIRSPWAILYRTLGEWFAHPGFTIIRVEGIEGPDANELVRVTFKYQAVDEPKERAIPEGEMVLDPSNQWCLKSYRLSKFWGTIECTFEYDGERAGIPFLQLSKEVLKGSGREAVTTISFTDLKHRVASDDEFTLSAFGLPEPTFQPTAPTPQYFYYLALAAVFLAAFLWMRGRKARRTNLGVAATA